MAVPVVVLQQIQAPAEKVFGFIANLEFHPQIARFCDSVRYTSDRREGVGVTFHQIHKDGTECDSEIVVWEPPTKIVWQNVRAGKGRPAQIVTYILEQGRDVTYLLHMVESGDYGDLAVHREATAHNLDEMERIKSILEG